MYVMHACSACDSIIIIIDYPHIRLFEDVISQFPTTSCYNMTFKAPCCYVFGVVLSELTTVSAKVLLSLTFATYWLIFILLSCQICLNFLITLKL